MKRIISLILTVVMLFGVVSVLGSCGAPDNPGAQIAVYLGDEVYDLDPSDYYVDSNAEALMALLYEPLFKITEKGKLKCAAAKDYEVDEDERKITITLRESYWSDGTLVIADHFIYAWKRIILESSNANPAAALFYDIEGALEAKSGENTIYKGLGLERTKMDVITITYREGADYKQLLKNLASVAASPINFNVYETAPAYWSKNVNTRVFNGPFSVNTFDRLAGELTLERNLGYHQDPETEDYDNEVRPHKLVSVFGVDGAQVELTYDDIESKTVFYMGNASLADRKENQKKAEVADTLSTYSYVFNTENPLFAIKEVRQALSLVIDRNAIIAEITFGKAANGFIPYAVKDTATGKTFRTQALIDGAAKLTEAQALLDSVSSKLAGVSKRFTLTVNNDEESLKIASLVVAAWESLGFTVTVDAVSSVTHEISEIEFEDSEIQVLAKNASYGKRDFDVLAVDWQMYSTDAFVGLCAFSTTMSGCGVDHTNGDAVRLNISGWQSSEYDKLMREAYEATDKETRSQKLHEAEKLLVSEAPIVPLVFNQSFYFANKQLKKLDFDGFGHVIFTDAKQKKYEKYLPKEED